MQHSANIFVLVDGLGWEWLKTIPFLNEHAPYPRPLTTVFGFSAGAIPPILTGAYPEAHGRVAMFHRVPENQSPFRDFAWLCAMPRAMVENRYVRHLVEYGVKAFHGFGGHFDLYAVPLRFLPMLDICEKRDIYRPGGIAGSTSIFDVLEARGQRYRSYSYHQGSDFELIRMALNDLKDSDATFYFLYLSQVDAFLHATRRPASTRARPAVAVSGASGRLDRDRHQTPRLRAISSVFRSWNGAHPAHGKRSSSA